LWQSEDTGWRELVPRFIESWQYDRTWARNLLDVAEPFGKDHQHRLQKMMTALDRQPDAEDTPHLLDDFTKLCQRQPFTIEQTLILQLQRGNWCYRQDNLQEALHLYLELANRLPAPLQRLKTDLAAALYALSRKFIWVKGASDARYSPEGEQAIIRAIELHPKQASYLFNKATILAKLKRYEEAIASYQQAIALDPNVVPPHNNLGNVYKDLKRYEEAIASYQQAIALDPNYADPHNGLGWTYLLIDQLVDSQTAFETAIKLDPENYSLWLNLGLVYAMQGNLDAAYTQWHQGLERFKNNNDWDNAVRALYTLALGNADQGIAAMQAVVAAGAAVGALQNVWGDAEILARCPQPPDGIAAMLHLLNTALAEAT